VLPDGGNNPPLDTSGHIPPKDQFVDEAVEIGQRFDLVDLVCNVVEMHPFLQLPTSARQSNVAD
jgi:hypothetical protein